MKRFWWASLRLAAPLAGMCAAWPAPDASAQPKQPAPKRAPKTPKQPQEPIPAPPPPDPSTEDVEYSRHMDLGIRLFEDRNYDAALTEFERAYQKRKKASPLINIALCYKGRFEYKKAILALEHALSDHKDSIDNPSKIQKAIDEMRELLGKVKIDVAPANVPFRIQIDADALDRGTEQSPIDVSPGGHTIVIQADGYEPTTRAFRIASGDALDLSFKLVPAEGTVTIDSAFKTAAISIDGDPLAADTYRRRLKPGMHLVEIVWPGRRHVSNFAITSGKTTSIKLSKSGALSVAGGPPKQPDPIAPPPVKGFYGIGYLDAGFRFGNANAATYATSVRAGYRVTRKFAVEAEIRGLVGIAEYTTPVGEVIEGRLFGTQIRAYAKVMSNTEVVRAVTSFGVGYTYEAVYAPDREGDPTGNGFCANIEPGLEVDLGHLILGFHTPFAFSISGIGPFLELTAGIQVGYGSW